MILVDGLWIDEQNVEDILYALENGHVNRELCDAIRNHLDELETTKNELEDLRMLNL